MSGLCPSCLLLRRKKSRVEVAGRGSWPCTQALWAPRHAGRTAGETSFQKAFKSCALRLPSWPVLPQWMVCGWMVRGQKCVPSEYTACSRYFWNRQKPSRKQLFPAGPWGVILHSVVHWETSCGEAVDTSRVEETNIFGFLNNNVGKITQHFNSF